MSYPMVYPVRTVGGMFEDARFATPQSSLVSGQKYVSIGTPTSAPVLAGALRGELRTERWLEPPFFSGMGEEPGAMQQVADWMEKNKNLVFAGALGLLFFAGARKGRK